MLDKNLKLTIVLISILLYIISLTLPALRTVSYELGVAGEHAWTWLGFGLLLFGFIGFSLGPAWLANFTFIYSVYSYARNKFKRAFISGGISFLFAISVLLFNLKHFGLDQNRQIVAYLPGYFFWLAAFTLITIFSYFAMIKNKSSALK